MKIRRVCIINQFGYNLYNQNCKEEALGGAEVQLYLLSKELADDPRLDVYVLTGKYINKETKLEIYNKIKLYQVLPLKIFPIRKNSFNLIFNILKFFIILKKINPDIIIQRAAGFSTALCALYCRIFKRKFVYSISSITNVNGEDAKGFYGKLYLFGLLKASYIVAQSLEQINILERWQNKKLTNISVIKSGHHITPPNLENKFTILWVARAERLKRPEIFLKLTENFPNQKFVMICNKSRDIDYWRYIKEKASKIINLTFLPYVLFDDINKYFINSKVFINTSIYEGFPNTFIQAMKNKTPILSLKINPDNVITNHKCGIVCNNCYNKMVNNLKLLLTNQDLYNKLSENALRYAKEHHDIDKISMKWINLLIKLYKSS